MSAEFPGAGGSWAPLPDEPVGPAAPTEPAGTRGPAGTVGTAWPDQSRRPFWARRPVVISAVAALALVGGASAAYATSGGTGSALASTAVAAATPSSGPSGTVPGDRHFGGFGGLGLGFGGGMLGAVHGQLVVPKSGGGYQTVDVQSGKVTAVSTTSITVKSADGFTQQYTVTGSTIVDAKRDTIGSVKSGDQVVVLATVSGSTATAVRIMDTRLIGQGRHGFGPGDGWAGHHGSFPGGTPGTSGIQPPPV